MDGSSLEAQDSKIVMKFSSSFNQSVGSFLVSTVFIECDNFLHLKSFSGDAYCNASQKHFLYPEDVQRY